MVHLQLFLCKVKIKDTAKRAITSSIWTCTAVKRSSRSSTLPPSLHLTMLTTSWNKQWSTNLIQIFKNCRKLKANPHPCQQLRTLRCTWLINCAVNMIVVFGQWPFDIHLRFCFVRKHELNNNVCAYHHFLHFFPATCSNSVETIEPAGAPQSGSGAQIDQSQMVLLRVWLCLSCLQNAALYRFLVFWTFLPTFLPWIYTHRTSLWHTLQTENIWFCHIRDFVCWEVSLRALVYPKCSRVEWQTYTDDTTSYIVIRRAMTWSLQTASRWTFSV